MSVRPEKEEDNDTSLPFFATTDLQRSEINSTLIDDVVRIGHAPEVDRKKKVNNKNGNAASNTRMILAIIHARLSLLSSFILDTARLVKIAVVKKYYFVSCVPWVGGWKGGELTDRVESWPFHLGH